MNRLYVVENRFTLTGSMADHRLRCPASQIPGDHARARVKNRRRDKRCRFARIVAGNVKGAGQTAKFDDQWLTEAANDLVSKPGASLVLAGSHQPVVVQLLVYGMNLGAEKCRTHRDGARVRAQY